MFFAAPLSADSTCLPCLLCSAVPLQMGSVPQGAQMLMLSGWWDLWGTACLPPLSVSDLLHLHTDDFLWLTACVIRLILLMAFLTRDVQILNLVPCSVLYFFFPSRVEHFCFLTYKRENSSFLLPPVYLGPFIRTHPPSSWRTDCRLQWDQRTKVALEVSVKSVSWTKATRSVCYVVEQILFFFWYTSCVK